MSAPQPPEAPRTRGSRRDWLAPAVLAAAGLSVASGFAQFAATATLGDVAAAFGEAGPGDSIVAQAGLAGSTLGAGLAVIRLASLASLPLAELADRRGRRGVLLGVASAGLALTAMAALAPTFWTLVAVLALGRPLLSATNAISGVFAAEETGAHGRARALGLVTAAYGLGAGLTALLRAVSGGMSFRWVFALAAVPLLAMPLLARRLHETDRYAALRERVERVGGIGGIEGVEGAARAEPLERRPGAGRYRLGKVPAPLRPRLLLLAVLGVALAFASGPVNGLLFLYAERIVGLAPSTTAVVVLAAGPVGLAGLLTGRWAADRFGRRVTAATAQVAVGLAGIATYRGGATTAIAGYLVSICASGAFGPAAAALAAELFPTSARATAAGWLTVSGVLGAVAGLLAFGALADAQGFAVAAWAVGAPVALLSPLYFRLPETRGLELEQSAPEPWRPGPG